MNTGCIGTVPASLTPGHFQNIEKSRSAILSVFAELELVLEAVPGATESQVHITVYLKCIYKMEV